MTAGSAGWEGRRLYLAYFAALGAVFPFQVIFLERVGLSPTEIGLLGSIAAAAAIVPGFAWATWSDRVGRTRPFVVFGLLVQMVVWLLFPLASRFGQFLMLMVAMSVLVPPLEALMNVWILGKLQRHSLGTGYSLVRIWGSIGWIISTVAVGTVVDATEVRVAFPIGAVLLAVSLLQPVAREGPSREGQVEGNPPGRRRPLSGMVPFAVATIIRAISVGMSYTFLSVYLDRIGTPFWLIGWGWAISAAPEVPIMVFAGRLSDRVGRIPLLGAGYLCSSAMALAFATTESPSLAIVLMSLSGVSYALTYISSVGYLAEAAPRHRQATAQGLFTILTTHLPRVIGPFLGGLIIDSYGLKPMFALSGSLTLFAAAFLIPVWRSGVAVDRGDSSEGDIIQ